MPWLVKALFILVKTRKGRELLFAVGLGAIELARHERARKLYAQARTTVTDPAIREAIVRNARRAAQAIRP
jgi:biotin carboxylase